MSQTLQARVGDQTFTLTREGDTLLLNGEPLDVRVTHLDDHTLLLVIDGKPQTVFIEDDEGGDVIATVNGKRIPVAIKTETDLLLERFGLEADAGSADREVRAPMPGLVLRVLVAPGDEVEAGQGVAVLEAMKMENELKAAASGTVAAVHAEAGAAVGKNDLLVELAE
ncbi:MAG: biotin/lipoyl-containing protein [Bacteroidota bacterium]